MNLEQQSEGWMSYLYVVSHSVPSPLSLGASAFLHSTCSSWPRCCHSFSRTCFKKNIYIFLQSSTADIRSVLTTTKHALFLSVVFFSLLSLSLAFHVSAVPRWTSAVPPHAKPGNFVYNCKQY